MINFVLAAGMITIILVIISVGIAWAIREHLAAQKYRYLMRLHHQMALQKPVYKGGGTQWKVTYREKGKDRTEVVEAETEELALKPLLLRGLAKNILKVEKV